MKTNFFITIIIGAFFLTNCADNKAATNEKQQTNNPSSEKKTDAASSSSAQGDDIVGEWEMVSSIVDTNDNLQIDEEERSKLKPVSFKDYMKLNRDGSGLFTIAKMEGRYEIKEEENNGRKVMTWYDKTNSPHRVGSIMKVTKDELHIKEPGGSGLFLWKRL
jgi:PBP1b-binding outer membrane lipoprotein LpoB